MEAKVPSKQDILMDSLITFYNIHDNISELLKILNNSSGVSLRIIDWFVTNYSKKNMGHTRNYPKRYHNKLSNNRNRYRPRGRITL